MQHIAHDGDYMRQIAYSYSYTNEIYTRQKINGTWSNWELIGTQNYSTSETKTNKKWIDGKPIYRKVLTIPSLTKATMTTSIGGDRLLLPGSTTVSSGISNMGFLINMYGSIYNNNNQMPAMFPLNFDYISYVYEKIVNNDTIYISTSSYENVFWCYYSIEDSALKIRTTSMNSTNDWVGYVVLEYTKTTD